MENALPEERKFFPVDRCLQRQLADIRPSHELFFSRAREDQHAQSLVIARIKQGTLQLLYCFAVQRIQYLRPVEGDVRNPVSLLIQNILVTHLVPFSALRTSAYSASLGYLFSFLGSTKTSAPSDSSARNNHEIPVLTSSRSIPPAPCALAGAGRHIFSSSITQTYYAIRQ